MSKSILLTNGCSMCYGTGLYDDEMKVCTNNQLRMENSWPGMLGRNFGFSEVVNLGYPSGSNDRILRTTIEWIMENWLSDRKSDDYLFVCIGWSGPMRREFFINDAWKQLIPYHDYDDTIVSIFNRIYRETAWSEYESGIRFATQIISLQSFLDINKIPYLFFDAIIPFSIVNQDADGALNMYVKQINKNNYLYFKDPDGCMSIKLGIDNNAAERGHPDLGGHKLWSEHLVKFIEENKLIEKKFCSNATTIFNGTGSVNIANKKIGLPKKPSSIQNNHFVRLDGINDKINQPKEKKRLISKIFNARKKDPYIYE